MATLAGRSSGKNLRVTYGAMPNLQICDHGMPMAHCSGWWAKPCLAAGHVVPCHEQAVLVTMSSPTCCAHRI